MDTPRSRISVSDEQPSLAAEVRHSALLLGLLAVTTGGTALVLEVALRALS